MEGCVRLSLSVVWYIIEVSAGAVMVVGVEGSHGCWVEGFHG